MGQFTKIVVPLILPDDGYGNDNATKIEYHWLRTVPTNSKVFVRGLLNVLEKQISKKCYYNPKRKLGVTTHFSKIINQQY